MKQTQFNYSFILFCAHLTLFGGQSIHLSIHSSISPPPLPPSPSLDPSIPLSLPPLPSSLPPPTSLSKSWLSLLLTWYFSMIRAAAHEAYFAFSFFAFDLGMLARFEAAWISHQEWRKTIWSQNNKSKDFSTFFLLYNYRSMLKKVCCTVSILSIEV